MHWIKVLQTFVLTLSVLTTVEGEFQKCNIGYRYVKKVNGQERCKQCRSCRGGYQLDFNVEVDASYQSENVGYLKCPPCIKCDVGYYREADSPLLVTCSKCVKDCSLLKRYQTEECGGTKAGHCGDCYIGHIAPNFDPNSICEPKPRTTSRTVLTNVTSVKNPSTVSTRRLQDYPNEADHLFKVVVVCLIILATILVALFVYPILKKNRNRRPVAREVGSDQTLLSSNNSNLSVIKTHNGNDIETDCVKETPIRGELPTSAGGPNQPECRHPQVLLESATYREVNETQPDTNGTLKKTVAYPKFVMKKTAGALKIISTEISEGKKVNAFFDFLKIPKAKRDPEYELWTLAKHSYKDFIINVLFIWIEREANNATLDKLCEALESAGFDAVLENVLQDSNANDSSTK